MSKRYRQIYSIVERIPSGKIATYGQIARLMGLPGWARQVGYALAALPEHSEVPWHRVVNAKGEISMRVNWGADELQRILLESEGVEFDSRNRISLASFQWQPAESMFEC